MRNEYENIFLTSVIDENVFMNVMNSDDIGVIICSSNVEQKYADDIAKKGVVLYTGVDKEKVLSTLKKLRKE